MSLGICHRAALILWALNRDLVIIELEAIAFHLNEQERQKVIPWVKVKTQATWSQEYY